MNPINPPLTLTAEKVIIHLIKEELKSHKFFEGLRKLDLDDTFYQTDLLELIMAGVGLPHDSQELYLFCHNLLKKHSARVTQDEDALLDEAKRVYGLFLKHTLYQ